MSSSSGDGSGRFVIVGCYTYDHDQAAYDTVNVVIEGTQIAKIFKGEVNVAEYPNFQIIPGKGRLLLPGFVNAHTHSTEFWHRGAIDNYPLELWLANLKDRCCQIAQELQHVYYSTFHCGYETLLTGGTAILDHISLPPGQELEALEHVYRAYTTLGIRAYVAPLVFDLPYTDCIAPCPGGGEGHVYQPQDTNRIVEWMEEAIQKYHRPENGFNMMIGPTGLQLCSDELYTGLIQLSVKYNLARHTHCLETANQKDLAFHKYGCSAVEQLEKLGFLGPKTTLAHSIHFTEKDMEIVQRNGATIVHNALSNLRLGSGIAPLLKYREKGVRIAIGCDGASSNDSQDLLEAIKIGTILHNITDPDYKKWIPPFDTIRYASLGGYTGLGEQERLGRVKEGYVADVVLYELNNLSLLPKTDPIRQLVLGRPVDVVAYSWVGGRCVIQDHKTAVDVEHLRGQMGELSTFDFERSAPLPTPLLEECEIIFRKSRGLPL